MQQLCNCATVYFYAYNLDEKGFFPIAAAAVYRIEFILFENILTDKIGSIEHPLVSTKFGSPQISRLVCGLSKYSFHFS